MAFLAASVSAEVPGWSSMPDDPLPTFSIVRPAPFMYLSVGQSYTWTVHANKSRNWLNLGLFPGEKYKFTVGSPEWNNGVRETTAAGYTQTTPLSPKYSKYKWMALVGELYGDDENPATLLKDTEFLIGSGRSSWVPFKSGWLVVFANDCWTCYGDNSRVVTLTVKRLE